MDPRIGRVKRAIQNGLVMAVHPRPELVRRDGTHDPQTWNILPAATVTGAQVGWTLGGPEHGPLLALAVVAVQTALLVSVASAFELFQGEAWSEPAAERTRPTAPAHTSAPTAAKVV